MDDEVKTEEGQENIVPEYTEIELAAIERGWKPKEEYTGDPSRWRNAEVFMALDEPLKRIESQSKELKRLREAQEALVNHHRKVEESAYQRALKTLQEERKEAFRVGEVEEALKIEDKIEELKANKPITPQVPKQESVHPEMQAWVAKNTWYTQNTAMKAAADAIGFDLYEQGKSPSEVLELVEAAIRKEFPHKFQNEKTTRPNTVESPTRSGGNTNSIELTPEEKKAMQRFVETGVMSKEDYIKEIKKMRNV